MTNPVAQLRYYFDATPPAVFGVRLSFQGNTTETVYDGSALEGNQEVRLGVVIPSQGLTKGRYNYTVEVVANGAVLHAYTGNLNWVNRNESVYGSGWGLGGVEELLPCSGGVLLVKGDGASLWYAEGSTPGSYLSPAGQMVEHAGPAPNADVPATRLVKYMAYSPQGLLIHTHDTLMRLEEYQYNAWGELAGFT